MKKFAQTIIAIALAAAGAQGFAATGSIIDQKLIDKVLARAEVDDPCRDCGPMLPTLTPNESSNGEFMKPVVQHYLERQDVACETFVLNSMDIRYQNLESVPLDHATKFDLLETCRRTFDAVKLKGETSLPSPHGMSGDLLIKYLSQPEAQRERSSKAFRIAKIFERAKNQYVSGPVMLSPSSKLSEQAEMELAGYERVGSFKKTCTVTVKRKGIDGKDQQLLGTESCSIYKERGKDLPSVSIN